MRVFVMLICKMYFCTQGNFGKMPDSGQIFELCSDMELRIEVETPSKSDEVWVMLKSGTAEIFGTEMVLNTKYKFKQGAKIAVYSYHGCQIFVSGPLDISPYISEETPMIMYLNIHAALEGMRKEAEKNSGLFFNATLS